MSPNVNLQMTETIKIKIVPTNNDKVIVIYCLSNKIEKTIINVAFFFLLGVVGSQTALLTQLWLVQLEPFWIV